MLASFLPMRSYVWAAVQQVGHADHALPVAGVAGVGPGARSLELQRLPQRAQPTELLGVLSWTG